MSRGQPLVLLLQVLHELQGCHRLGAGVSLEELAEACEVSTRTVRRKLEALGEAGIPVEKAKCDDGRTRYRVDHRLLPSTHVTFDPEEAAALYVAEGMMASMEGLPLVKEAREALEKASKGVPAALRRELTRHVEALRGSLQGQHEYAPYRVRFRDLVDAICERWPTEIDYRSPGRAEPRPYRVEPYLLHCHAGTVYLVARWEGRDGLSTYALDRIAAARPDTEATFARDPAFDPQRFVGESFGGYHEGELVDVSVRFEPAVAPVILERTWHGSQRTEQTPDGAVVVRLRTAGPTGVLHWAKAFLPHSRILAPAWLADRQRGEALAWAESLAAPVEPAP